MFKLKRPSPKVGFYSFREEFLNSLTHGLGTLLAAVGVIALVTLAILYGDPWRVVSFTIYGSTLFFLYLASTLYHGVPHSRWKRFFRLLDHTAVYLFIAGTYTPFLLVFLRGPVGWTMLGVVWGLALLGIAFKTLFIGRFEKWATLGYVLMGWMCLIAFQQMIDNIPPWGLFGILLGGVLYTTGVLFFTWDRLPYNHTIWHLFVMGGSTAHFVTILLFVLPLGSVVS